MKSILVLLMISTVVYSQSESLVTITTPFGEGTGVVISKKQDSQLEGYLGEILTANHVVEGIQSVGTIYTTGQKAQNGRISKRDTKNDVAIIETWIPNTVGQVKVGEAVNEKEKVYLYTPRGVFPTKISVIYDGNMFADIYAVPGDSGAPILNRNKEVVGVISGGNFWVQDKKIKAKVNVLPDSKEVDRTPTWPLRAGNVFSVIKLLGN